MLSAFAGLGSQGEVSAVHRLKFDCCAAEF